MPSSALAERRTITRYATDDLFVGVRRKGRLSQLHGLARDFNRHGLALVLDQPLPKDATVYVSLSSGETHVDNIVGVVHNCFGLEMGYRCGIAFRTDCGLQMDQGLVKQTLCILEARFKLRELP